MEERKENNCIIRPAAVGDRAALSACLEALAAHHNRVSLNFAGDYPRKPSDKVIEDFFESVSAGSAEAVVAEVEGCAAGFAKISFCGDEGWLDYLFVLEEYRKKGYGAILMDWAMAEFERLGVRKINVKVVCGNDAVGLYEKYGFKMNAYILSARPDKSRN